MIISNTVREQLRNKKLDEFKEFKDLKCPHQRTFKSSNPEGGVAVQCADCRRIIKVIKP